MSAKVKKRWFVRVTGKDRVPVFKIAALLREYDHWWQRAYSRWSIPVPWASWLGQ